MKLLCLSEDFELPQLERIPFESFTFNGGEPHLKLQLSLPGELRHEEVLIAQRIQNPSDFMLLLLATDAVRRAGCRKVSALLPYFPAARQDRVMTPGEPLSLKVYAGLVNAQHFEKVWVFDPHSEVTPALLDRCEVISNVEYIRQVVQLIGSRDLALVAPDAGATKKVQNLAVELSCTKIVQCTKMRDVHSGQLSNFHVFADNLNGQDCLIVDDICDGGGTFVGIAKALKEKEAGRVFLAVSHGIFSDGFEKFKGLLDGIFSTDAFREIESNLITQMNLSDILPVHFFQPRQKLYTE